MCVHFYTCTPHYTVLLLLFSTRYLRVCVCDVCESHLYEHAGAHWHQSTVNQSSSFEDNTQQRKTHAVRSRKIRCSTLRWFHYTHTHTRLTRAASVPNIAGSSTSAHTNNKHTEHTTTTDEEQTEHNKKKKIVVKISCPRIETRRTIISRYRAPRRIYPFT